jgi:hypothetical protein
MPRTYQEELKYLEKLTPHSWRIKKGFVPNMNVSDQVISPCLLVDMAANHLKATKVATLNKL